MSLVVFSATKPGYDHEAAQGGVVFRDDSWYWALYPHFENLRSETGRRLDLYGDAVFDHYMLPVVLKHLQRARADAASRAEQFEVKSAWHPERGDVMLAVSRHDLIQLLDRLEGITAAALADGKILVALGD
jgi:hypothetical protein